jgi:hypothetical protein
VNLKQIADELGLESLTPEAAIDDTREIVAGYASDLLSDVLAHGPDGGVLVTVQVHLNVVAVAVHAGLAAVIFALDRRPDENTRRRAGDEGVALYTSPLDAFEIVGRLHALGLRGTAG